MGPRYCLMLDHYLLRHSYAFEVFFLAEVGLRYMISIYSLKLSGYERKHHIRNEKNVRVLHGLEQKLSKSDD